jgi:hypothetical protein
MQNVGIFYGHLEYITAIWYVYFVDIYLIFPRFGTFCQKIWQPCPEPRGQWFLYFR